MIDTFRAEAPTLMTGNLFRPASDVLNICVLAILTSFASITMPVFWQLPIRQLVICTQSVGDPSRSGKIWTVFSLHISMSELVILNSQPVSMLMAILAFSRSRANAFRNWGTRYCLLCRLLITRKP